MIDDDTTTDETPTVEHPIDLVFAHDDGQGGVWEPDGEGFADANEEEGDDAEA